MERPNFPEVIDSTMRGAFVSCPQKFFQEFILNRAPKDESTHLVAGAAFAKGLEVTRLAFYFEKMDLDQAILEGIIAALAEYKDHEHSTHGSAKHKSADRVALGIIEYFRKYDPRKDHIQPYVGASGRPAVEFTFAIPIGIDHPVTGNPIIYAGRFDWIGRWHRGIWVVDEKTTGQLGNSWIKQWPLRAQLTGYCWAARESGIDVEGAIVRGMSFLGKSYGHAEVMSYRPAWQVDRWYQQLLLDIDRMVFSWKRGHWDYNLDSACSAYGGCLYQRLCEVNNPDEWAPQYFTERTWSPLSLNPSKSLEEQAE